MKNEELLQKLTLEEKASLLVGKDAWNTMNIDRLGIPSVAMADGPHGLRKVSEGNPLEELAEDAICYPSLVTIASSFDPDISKQMGSLIAKEFRSKDVQLILGPGVNIKRHPYCGRNFEYFSEDPVVTTKMARGYIQGAKENKTGVCLKHYALNSQESYRMISNSIVDERAKYEIYYKSFQELVQLDPEMVMCSYNKVEGTYASESIYLLQEVLRKEFGFHNVIVSDWTAVNNRTKALIASLDLEMPGAIYGVHTLIKDFKKGLIQPEVLDASVKRILELVEKFKDKEPVEVDLQRHHEAAVRLAEESFVLMKNKDHILPLHEDERVLVVGDMAHNIRIQGGGSSHINTYKTDTILEHLIRHDNVDYFQGYHTELDEIDSVLSKEVIDAASNYDKIVFVGGLPDRYESEGYDREHLSMPQNQEYLIQAIAKENNNIIVVLQLGSPIVMPFLHSIKGLLNCYLGGEGLGIAVDRVLFGYANPSGRLAETFPKSIMDVPSNPYFATGNNYVFYQESIYVGYRYYNTANKEVLFPFGYGLSYSHFEYSNIRTTKSKLKNQEESLTISVDITNNGPFDGKEVCMLFFEAKNPKTPRPKRELMDFQKVFIPNKETVTVTFKVKLEDFAYYHPKKHKFTTDDGVYSLQIMRNARDVFLETPVEVIIGKEYVKSDWNDLLSYQVKGGLTFKPDDFAILIQQEVKDQHQYHKHPFTINNSIEDIEHTFFGKIIKKQITKQLIERMKDQTEDFRLMVIKSIYQMPLRSVALNSGGEVSVHFMEGLIALVNHRFLKAIKNILSKD
ncbi:MAG: glycoside hydrolase family 3 C-terminal domain-containing protein [Bacilli bacterium]|nr:glycoside hydrolase family 3 C-terminal domain-containing protein [Bacilli bacterium]MBN2876086.1 glycoside hydrolase family 3 C-terminal domain-containing protein [Bacilli bacterium]